MIFSSRAKAEAIVLKERVQELESEVVRLRNNLIHDPLTGLKTRAFFEEEVSTYLEIINQQNLVSQFASTQRKEKFGFHHLSIVFFDIDHFKKVNDTYGHSVGDMVLRKVAETIQSTLRTGDTLARWGGEEMVANLLGANEQDAAIKAEDIRKKVEELDFLELKGLKITLSAGVAASGDKLNLKELIKRSDEAMYRAKDKGRNKVYAFSDLQVATELTA